MPSATTGYTRNELINLVMSMIGSNNANLSSYMQSCMSGWQNEFFQMHDWTWSHNTARCGPSPVLDTIIGQRCYDITSIGNPIVLANNIESIVCITSGGGRKLVKTNMQDIRAVDPEGIQQGRPTFWCWLNMTEIEFWPIPDVAERFVIEGKFEPDFISGASDVTLQIPYKYQDCFKQYLYCNALQFERDPNFAPQLAVFQQKLKLAIDDDNRSLEENLRMKTVNEQITSPGIWDLNSRLWFTGH